MITVREYDQLCKFTDDLISATEALYTTAAAGDIKEAAKRFTAAEAAWEAFTTRLIEDTATTATDADGWTEWRGGVCPVKGYVDIKIRGGGISKNYPAGAGRWVHDNREWDIIAYRLVS